MCKIIEMIPNMCNVAERKIALGRLEKWWVAFDREEFYPPNRKYLGKGWFWRLGEKD